MILEEVKNKEQAILNTNIGKNKVIGVVFGIDFVPLYAIIKTEAGQQWKASIREGVNGFSFSFTKPICG